MGLINEQIFNPEIIYAFDCWNDPGSFCDPHSHEFAEISIMLEGASTYSFEGRQQEISANSILLFNPGVIHFEAQAQGTYSHQLHIGIKNFSFAGYIKDVFPNQAVTLIPPKNPNPILDLAWKIVDELNREEMEYRTMIKALVMELMIGILRLLEAQQTLSMVNLSVADARKQDLVQEAIAYLKQHYQTDISLDMIAQNLLISPAYLTKIFKESENTTLISYLINLRMQEACRLLTQTSATIKEVAYSVGYQDPLYFSKQFKRTLGISPKTYRKEREKSLEN